MSKSQRSFGSKVRIATAGLVLGLAASLVSTTAAHAVPKGDGFGCTINPQLCEEDGGGGFGCALAPQLCEDPPEPPKPPKCQIILCDGDGPVLDPGTNPEAEPEPEPEPEPQPEPTQEPEEPKTEEPKQEETQNETPADNGQNNGNGSGTVRTRTAGNNGQVQQVEAAPAATDEVQTVAQNQTAEAENGLSQFAKLLIIVTLAGAGFGLVTYLRQRKHS